VTIVGLLIGVLGGVVALLSAGMPDLPRLTLLLEPGLTALGLLLKALLALFCLTLTVAGRGQLSFEYPAALPEALKSSQVGELVGELLAVGSRVLGLLAGGCGVSERVGHLGVAWHESHHPRCLGALLAGPLQLRGGLVALLAGAVKPGALLLAPFALIGRLTPRPAVIVAGARSSDALSGVLALHALLVRQRHRDRRNLGL